MLLAGSLLLLHLLSTVSAVDIYHRIYIPNSPEPTFLQRGSVDSSHSSTRFQPSSSLSQHWLEFAALLQNVQSLPDISLDRVLYQIGLEREGREWDIASVKLCHLPFVNSESIILHTPHSAQFSTAYAIDYFVSPVPHDGSCPKQAGGPAGFASPFQALSELNTTVSITHPTLPPLPQLRTPPPLTAEGEPVKPVVEKSFIQKYWMYIAAVLVVMLMTGGSEEEGQSSGGR